MPPERNLEQEQELLFVNLILMLSENAWTMLGKRVHPVSGKEEIELPAARAMIDTLGALKDRTEGRLTDRERQMLEMQLTNLRLNYVEVLRENPKPGTAAGESTEQPA